jgi:hypothetical protein
LYVCVKASPFAAKIVFALNKIYRLRPMADFLFFSFFFFSFFLFQSGICFRCHLDNPRRFPNFQLPTIGVTADFYIHVTSVKGIAYFLPLQLCSFIKSKSIFVLLLGWCGRV